MNRIRGGSGAQTRPSRGLGEPAATPFSGTFQLGAIVKPLSEQFAEQGIFANPNSIAMWQARMEAIVTLRLGDVLTWGQALKAYDRLGKQIWRGLKGSQTRFEVDQ